jgi:hypothetical protein
LRLPSSDSADPASQSFIPSAWNRESLDGSPHAVNLMCGNTDSHSSWAERAIPIFVLEASRQEVQTLPSNFTATEESGNRRSGDAGPIASCFASHEHWTSFNIVRHQWPNPPLFAMFPRRLSDAANHMCGEFVTPRRMLESLGLLPATCHRQNMDQMSAS